MKLDKIIKAVRSDMIRDLLTGDLSNAAYEHIILYAENTISTDTDYRFFRWKRNRGELVKEGEIWFERLCSLDQLCLLIDYFLLQYSRKTDDILVIDIIDHLDNQNN
jgi:hypothetical protein